MAHPAFTVIGKAVALTLQGSRNKIGLFQESNEYATTAEGARRPALDFIEPLYQTNPMIEKLAKGKNPRERVCTENPILSLHLGIDHLRLRYGGKLQLSFEGKNIIVHFFRGELMYVCGAYFNDGNFEVYDQYREVLRKAGFRVL